MKRALPALCLLLGSLAVAGCELDLQDPNRPTEEEVFGSAVGVQSVAIGMQAHYADMVRNPIWVVGLVTDQIGAGENAFQDYINVDLGEPIRPGYYNTAAFDPWTGMYEVVKLTNDVLRVTPDAPGLGAGTRSGMIALAKLYKAMAFGHLAQLYQRFPIEVGEQNPNPGFVDRAAALTEILRLLQEARAELQATPPSDLFRDQILAPGFDLMNTIEAMTARYALIAGNHELALQASQRVDPNVLSVLEFTEADPNSLWNLWYRSGNAYQMRPEQSFRLQAEPGDQRVSYWVRPDTLRGATGRLDELNRYNTATAPLPIYLPDEMRLIRAEVYAGTDRLAEARAEVNAVRTQCTSTVAEPTACLPALTAEQLPTREAILAEILRQRRYELYLQGLRFEDQRRFGAPMKYPWMPVPLSECDRNPNASC